MFSTLNSRTCRNMCIWRHKFCNAKMGVGPTLTWSNEAWYKESQYATSDIQTPFVYNSGCIVWCYCVQCNNNTDWAVNRINYFIFFEFIHLSYYLRLRIFCPYLFQFSGRVQLKILVVLTIKTEGGVGGGGVVRLTTNFCDFLNQGPANY